MTNKQTTRFEGDVMIASSYEASVYGNGELSIASDLTVSGTAYFSGVSGINHSELDALLVDDHTQYSILNGRSSGQILHGGVLSGDNLTLRSSINATKGSIILDETTPSTSSILGSMLLSGGISISNTTDAISFTNGGTFTTAGGVAIEKKLFVNGTGNFGSGIDMGSTKITSLATPTDASDGVNKSYVDSVVQASILYNEFNSSSTSTTNTTTTDSLVLDMSLVTSMPGTFLLNFNCECDIPDSYDTKTFDTAVAKSDLDLIYNDIIALTQTQSHAIAFGGGETIYPGVYIMTGAVTIAGTLTLNGLGDSNSIFVIRSPAAFNTGAGVTVLLVDGAQSKNIYWVAQDAIGLGANTHISGLLFSNNGAIALGADCILSGARVFTKSGAIGIGPGILSKPTVNSTISMRSLDNFIVFTGAGGISNTGVCIYTGDIATDLGAITGFSTATVDGIIYQQGVTITITQIYHAIVFSLHVNDVLVPNSERKKTINTGESALHAVATLSTGDTVKVKCRVDNQVSDNGGVINIHNRIITVIKIS
jgi:hypothetical protein